MSSSASNPDIDLSDIADVSSEDEVENLMNNLITRIMNIIERNDANNFETDSTPTKG